MFQSHPWTEYNVTVQVKLSVSHLWSAAEPRQIRTRQSGHYNGSFSSFYSPMMNELTVSDNRFRLADRPIICEVCCL